jgi:bacterioferritin
MEILEGDNRTYQGESAMENSRGITHTQTFQRSRAGKQVDHDAMTAGYKAKLDVVIQWLNEALAAEIVCFLRYKQHYFMATGASSESVKTEFLRYASEEQSHADQIAQRILQLGGEPNLSPKGLLGRSHASYMEVHCITDMIVDDLIAERSAIDRYREMIMYVGSDDSTTSDLLESILAKELEHADDLATLLQKVATESNS